MYNNYSYSSVGMAILYLCVLLRKPFISIILHIAMSNMIGYVGRPDELLGGEQKPD